MAANVESMFYVRQAPWHGLGVQVEDSPTSEDALIMSGLNWNVVQKDIFTPEKQQIENYKANIREVDNQVLGVVTNRYKIVQNHDAFAFTDSLLGEGVTYETAGSLQNGKKVWLLAKLPNKYQLLDDQLSPYLVFSNSHDGSGSIKVAMTPIRVVCQNTLNLALNEAKRVWSINHTGNINNKLQEAMHTLKLADQYINTLGHEAFELHKHKLTDTKVLEFIEELIPMPAHASPIQERNISYLREDFKLRYFEAPDLKHLSKSSWRFINAASDFATHITPLRKTTNYQDNLFAKTIEGNVIIDKAYDLVRSVA